MLKTLDDHAVSICEPECTHNAVAYVSGLWHQRDGLKLAAFLDRADRPKAGVADEVWANFGEALPCTRHAEQASPVQPCITPGELTGWPVLPGYQILAELGRGGMGIVYKARQLSLARIVAIKVIDPGLAGESGLVARFQQEKLLTARLTHPNLVTAYDAGQINGLEYLVMELVEGVGLDRLLEKCGSFPIAEACEVVRQATLGLQHLHEHGLVHRDIKPSNLMLTPAGQVKVLDLGLARLLNEPAESGPITSHGQFLGTLDYMAPEQCDDCHTVDSRADIYSLGCTLYQLLAGRPPFAAPEYESGFLKMKAHVEAPVPPIRESRPDVSECLAAILNRMLAKDRKDRFASPADVVIALQPFGIAADLAGLMNEKREHSSSLPCKLQRPVPDTAKKMNVPFLPALTSPEWAQQATLLDQVPGAVLVRDLDNRVRFWNRGAEKLYGWKAAEVLGRNVNEFLFRDPSADLAEVTRAVLEQGEWSGELRQVTRDGREIIVEARWVLLRDYQGRPEAKLAVNTDITVRKKLEAQLLRAQRLESIGTLTGGIAHDFNNLLNPILMSAKLLLEMDRPEDEQQHLLKVLQASAERGAEMVKGLLAFASGAERQMETLNPGSVVHEVKAILDHTLPKSVQIETFGADGLWPVRADATLLSQVLMNLCVNARDAMPDGGTLTISAENRHVDHAYARRHPGASSGPYVAISVADTGSGIPPEHIDRIFDPFFTTKEQGKGTGLGLSTALAIVKSHGGFINVSSESGKGTRFVIHLPALTGAETESAVIKGAEIPRRRGDLILVVEDEPHIRDTTKAA